MTAHDSPASLRNRGPILTILAQVLPPGARVLEVASGTGTHAAFFSRHLANTEPPGVWQPSDVDVDLQQSVRAHRALLRADGVDTLLAPITLDTSDRATWPTESFDAVYCANMVHIAPIEAAAGLFLLAGERLDAAGVLITYGPYRIAGTMAESNARFDASLKSRDPRWGIRDLEQLEEFAAAGGLGLAQQFEMPANNHTLVWRRTPR